MTESKKELTSPEDDIGEVVGNSGEDASDSDESGVIVEDAGDDRRLDAVLDELAALKSGVAQTSERLDIFSESAGQLEAISGDVKELLRFRGMITGVIDRLHEEIEEKKSDTRHKALKPFLKDLILFYDDLAEVHAETAEALGEEHRAVKALAMLADSVLEILYRADVEPFENEDDTLDVSTQKTIEVREVSEKELDTRVIEVVRTGFSGPEGILRREQVVVGKYVEGDEEEKEVGEETE